MSLSWAELQRVADRNSRTAQQKLEDERRRREQIEQNVQKKTNKTRAVDEEIVQSIIERRQREQLEKKADERRLQQANQEKKQQKTVIHQKQEQKKQQQQQIDPEKKRSNVASAGCTASVTNKKINGQSMSISYDDLLRYAALKTNNQPIPKDLAHVAQSLQPPKKSLTRPTSVVSSTAKTLSITQKKSTVRQTTTKSSNTPTNLKKPTTIKSSVQMTQSKPIASSAPPKLNPQPPRPASNIIKRPSAPAPLRRPPSLPVRKRPMIDTDDEDEYDEEMRDFIVDDDDDNQDENNNSHGGRFNYRKELEETLKNNFRFDKSKYAGMRLDDDDLRNMESSFSQIQKEEDYSRKQGLREDVEDVMREEAEKKRRMQLKKRSKPTT